MHGRVGLELDAVVDPRGVRVDDRDAGEHVRVVDPVAQDGGDLGELDARVDSLRLDGIRREVHGDRLAVLDEEADGVGDVELALRVVRLKSLERAPQLVRAEHVDAGVDLADFELVRRRVAGLDDAGEAAVVVADDSPVRARIRRLEGEDGRGRVRAAMLGEERLDHVRAQRGHVAVQHEHVAVEAVERSARSADGVPGAERRLLDGDRDALERVPRVRRGDDDDGIRARAGGGRDHPVHEALPEQRMEVLGRGRVHPGPEATGHDDCCEVCAHCVPAGFASRARWLGRQDSNLGSRDQNPLPYRLATPQSWEGDSTVGRRRSGRVR